ncbi:hypothetical protein NQ318_015033 [Aromia moschata]|uniref:Major facilitator superfamily (MFS) profile domain-containing protein n=1 Tax=Aromia moschata TaxID=1265417 RepID=A0AAV8YYM5_9CUCU|nr:hypothetical protein NQ318_015033 [Aromia moschata]
MTSGYSAILLPQLQPEKKGPISVDPEQASWIASMAALPMATGCILGGILTEKFGRKSAHVLTCLPTLIGWLIIAFATNTSMLLVGRFVTGICTGMLGPATGVYIGETSEPKYRGFLLAGISFSVSLGLFLSHLLGTFLHWKTTALACSALPVVSLFLMLFVPESPSWLAKKGKIKKAENAFRWCRGASDSAKKELTIMLQRQNLQSQEKEKNLGEKLRELAEPEFLKPLGIIAVYIVANQWSGVNAITFYTVSIMKQTIGDGVNEYLAMLVVDVIRVLMSILACVLLRRLGRRPLAIVSGVGTTLALFTLSAFTYLVTVYPKVADESYIPLTALVAYISFISIGFVPLPWAMIGEIFPLRNRSVGSAISSFLAFTAFFSVVKTSPGMFSDLGPAGTFSIYGTVACLGTVFVAYFLPETKGRPLHEIEDEFRRTSKNVYTVTDNN